MTDLNDFGYTDNFNDVLAVYVNRLLASTMRSEYKNVETLAADKTLTDADTPIQRLDCNGAARIVKVPTVDAVENHPFFIVNSSSGAYAITLKSNDGTTVITTIPQGQSVFILPDGAGTYCVAGMERETAYKIVVSVASSDLILSLTHIDGTTPSTSRPLWFLINGTWRAVSAATSCTLADGTNWMNLGAAETAAIEQDLFAYVIWDSNSSVVAIAPSRIPYGKLVSDFNATTTNERYIGNYANYSSTDDVVVIGRFAATLSAGAGYTWTSSSHSAPTNLNTVHHPIYNTRRLTYYPSPTNVTVGNGILTGNYLRNGRQTIGYFYFEFGSSGSAVSGAVSLGLPVSVPSYIGANSRATLGEAGILDTGVTVYQALYLVDKTIRVRNTSGTYETLTQLSSTVPMTWAVGDTLSGLWSLHED